MVSSSHFKIPEFLKTTMGVKNKITSKGQVDYVNEESILE